MGKVICKKHGTGEGIGVCAHITPDALVHTDISKSIVTMTAERDGKKALPFCVCIDCVSKNLAGIEPHNPQNIDGFAILRRVATESICLNCLQDYGILR